MLLRLILTTLVVLLCFAVSNADSLVVRALNGTKSFYELDNKPVISFTNSSVIIKSLRETIIYSIDDVDSIYYDHTTSSIHTITIDDTEELIELRDRELYIHQIEEDCNLFLFTTDGKAVFTAPLKKSDYTVVSLSGLTTGIYIVRYGNHSRKISLR